MASEAHYHLSIEHVLLMTIAVGVGFHVFRIVGGLMANPKAPGIVQAAGKGVGGFATFGGTA